MNVIKTGGTKLNNGSLSAILLNETGGLVEFCFFKEDLSVKLGNVSLYFLHVSFGCAGRLVELAVVRQKIF